MFTVLVLVASVVLLADSYALQHPKDYRLNNYYNYVDEAPKPYSFSYSAPIEDGTGAQSSRVETGDEQGTVRGSYSLNDDQGHYRTVDYIADDAGFRASVRTNEPGTDNQNPAGVTVQSDASDKPIYGDGSVLSTVRNHGYFGRPYATGGYRYNYPTSIAGYGYNYPTRAGSYGYNYPTRVGGYGYNYPARVGGYGYNYPTRVGGYGYPNVVAGHNYPGYSGYGYLRQPVLGGVRGADHYNYPLANVVPGSGISHQTVHSVAPFNDDLSLSRNTLYGYGKNYPHALDAKYNVVKK